MSENNNLLKKLYYDPSEGFISARKLLIKAQKINPKIKLEEVKNFINSQFAYQVNKRAPKVKKFNSIYSAKVNNNWQMDIMVYDRYEFNKYKYIFCIVDVYSRCAWTFGLTNHTLPNILKCLDSVVKESGAPKNINCDNEFNKASILEWGAKHNVTFHFSQANTVNHNAIVERFNRTIAELLQKYRTATKKYNWNTYLDALTKNYNSTVHSSTKATPISIYEGENINRQKITVLKQSFKVGDQV